MKSGHAPNHAKSHAITTWLPSGYSRDMYPHVKVRFVLTPYG